MKLFCLFVFLICTGYCYWYSGLFLFFVGLFVCPLVPLISPTWFIVEALPSSWAQQLPDELGWACRVSWQEEERTRVWQQHFGVTWAQGGQDPAFVTCCLFSCPLLLQESQWGLVGWSCHCHCQCVCGAVCTLWGSCRGLCSDPWSCLQPGEGFPQEALPRCSEHTLLAQGHEGTNVPLLSHQGRPGQCTHTGTSGWCQGWNWLCRCLVGSSQCSVPSPRGFRAWAGGKGLVKQQEWLWLPAQTQKNPTLPLGPAACAVPGRAVTFIHTHSLGSHGFSFLGFFSLTLLFKTSCSKMEQHFDCCNQTYHTSMLWSGFHLLIFSSQ